MNIQPIVVGVDGSPDSKNALRWAAEYGRRFEAPVHAVALWAMAQAPGYPLTFAKPETVEVQAQARTMLEETIVEVLGENSSVTTEVRQGHPKRELVAESESAQLLVVGSRGYGAFVGTLMGSVSQHCVQRAHCPVVVMRASSDNT